VIATVFKIMLLSLLRDRGALVMALVLPAVFMLIMAEVFASRSVDALNLKIALVDEVQDQFSQRFLARLQEMTRSQLHYRTMTDTRAAIAAVRAGSVDVALIFPAEGERFDTITGLGTAPVRILGDPTRQIAVSMVRGMVEKVYFLALPDAALANMIATLEDQFITLTPEQHQDIAAGLAELRDDAFLGQDTAAGPLAGLVEVESIFGSSQVMSLAAYSAGAIAVMFLLFSSAHGAISLLEEQESGILDRVLAGPNSIGTFLNGKLIYLTTQGVVQTSIIFLIARLRFGVDLLNQAGSWFIVTLLVATAASSLTLLITCLCRTRHQARMIMDTTILLASALGGSMVPRFLMPETLQKIGWLTPNAWAIEAYNGLLREQGLAGILLPVSILVVCILSCWTLTHWLARRRMLMM